VNRIESIFAQRKTAGRPFLMPFICGGYPTVDATADVLLALERAGASIAEIGIPFSDPIADGPVIAEAMHEALKRGVTPARVFGAVERVRAKTNLGLVAMVSVSIVQRVGAAQFVAASRLAGFDGLIVPDVPVEESEELRVQARGHGLTLSLLVAPTTPPDRARRIVAACTGFVYVLARVGITGEAPNSRSAPGSERDGRLASTPPSASAIQPPAVDAGALAERIALLRSMTDLPIACGFGISTPEHVALVVGKPPLGAGADAAIVGSALVKKMGRAGPQAVDEAEGFVRSLVHGLAR